MKLLVVEDEEAMAVFLRRGLTEQGFVVDLARDADEADEAVSTSQYDAIILDGMIPGGDGFDLCRAWRAAGVGAPILFLTARDGVGERVRGLELGGDDYLVKPFAFSELVARVRALLRRRLRDPEAPLIEIGELILNPARRRVTLQGNPVTLSQREYQLLEHLARASGSVVTRTELWEHVWESHAVPDSNVIDVYIRHLRDKLGRELIQTVRGVGYILEPPASAGG